MMPSERQLHDDLSNVIGNNQLKKMKLGQHSNHPQTKYISFNRRERGGDNNINSLLEANISDIDFDLEEDTEKDINTKVGAADQSFMGLDNEYAAQNFSEDSVSIPEVPFVHWSIYRQSI